jgi:hypothetical protein
VVNSEMNNRTVGATFGRASYRLDSAAVESTPEITGS